MERERERWSNPSFHRRASNSRKKKKKKTSRDHVLGENGKSEDVAEDSSLKQQPSEGNREQESEFCSTLFLVQPAHTNAVLFNRDIHTRTHTVTVGRTHTQMYYTTISSHIYLAWQKLKTKSETNRAKVTRSQTRLIHCPRNAAASRHGRRTMSTKCRLVQDGAEGTGLGTFFCDITQSNSLYTQWKKRTQHRGQIGIAGEVWHSRW